MGKARVYGNSVKLFIHSQDTLLPIPLGELDSFSARSLTSVHKSRPTGYINVRATLKYDGWDLSFDGGKVDWALCHFYWLQDNKLRANQLQPDFFISETIFHFNGAIENYVYQGVTLFGLDLTRAGEDELKEKINGFAAVRALGPVDTTDFQPPGGDVNGVINAIHEVIFRTSNPGLNAEVQKFQRPF